MDGGRCAEADSPAALLARHDSLFNCAPLKHALVREFLEGPHCLSLFSLSGVRCPMDNVRRRH